MTTAPVSDFPQVPVSPLTTATAVNDVWTCAFKGQFRMGDHWLLTEAHLRQGERATALRLLAETTPLSRTGTRAARRGHAGIPPGARTAA